MSISPPPDPGRELGDHPARDAQMPDHNIMDVDEPQSITGERGNPPITEEVTLVVADRSRSMEYHAYSLVSSFPDGKCDKNVLKRESYHLEEARPFGPKGSPPMVVIKTWNKETYDTLITKGL